MGALSHLRVLDLSRILAGPWCGQIFADLGADVIKVERPGCGDDTRSWGPPWLSDDAGEPTSEAGYYLSANRGKRSITIDIAAPGGQALVRELVKTSDVLIENYKLGGLARYGLDYDSLRAVNPGLVYCSITGFGQTGPHASRPGYDFMIQAMSGVMSVTGERDDRPGGGPQKVGVAVADITTGMYATVAIQAALAHRERTGEGQHIDMALMDCAVALMANQAMNYLLTGNAPGRAGNAHPNIVPYQVFAAADGHLIIAVGNDAQYARLCELLGAPELIGDERFDNNHRRVENRRELIALLEQRIIEWQTGELLQALEERQIPCGPINNLDQVFADPQMADRNMRQEQPHALAGRVPLVGSPMKMSRTPPECQRPPPLLGEHTEEILRELLDYGPQQIETLRADGVI